MRAKIGENRNRILFRLPLMIFNEIMTKYRIVQNQKNFNLIWLNNMVPAIYVVLPDHSEEPISLVFADMEQTQFRSVRLMLINGIPPVFLDELDYSKLDIYSSVVVSELESGPSDHNDKGYDVRLCLEFISSDAGVVDVTNDKILSLDVCSTHIKSIMYDFYLSKSVNWVRDSIRFNSPHDI